MIWLISLNLTAIILGVINIVKAKEVWEFLVGGAMLYANVYLVLWGIELYLKGRI